MDQITIYFTPRAFELVGVAGFALYVLNYLFLTFQVFCARHLPYFIVNLVAASCVAVSLAHSFNLASMLIQVFWIVISVVAIGLRLTKTRRRAHRPLGPAAPATLS